MIDIVRTRRSVRNYEKRSIDPAALAIMKEAVLRSPSSRGLNPWTFVFVDDADTAPSAFTGEGGGITFSRGRGARHRCLRRRVEIGCMGRGLRHRRHSGPAHRPFPGSRKLLDPDQEEIPFGGKTGGGVCAGGPWHTEEPVGGLHHQYRLPGQGHAVEARDAARLRKDTL